MDKDFIDILKENSKNNMPDLWGKIESKLETKKKKNKKNILSAVASIAVIFSIAITGRNILMKDNNLKAENSINQEVLEENEETSENSNSQNSEASISIDVLPDLNLQEMLEDKIVGSYGISSGYVTREINIKEEAISIVYGKVVEVNGYLQEDMINSYLTIEVIEDYKKGIKEGDVITVGSSGGEMLLEDYNKEASHPYILNSNSENGKDEGKRVVYGETESEGYKIINLNKGVPQYRTGEYVLVYLFEVNKEGYYSLKDEKYYKPPVADYGIYSDGRLYVNPNTREVFKYEYNMNNTLEKEKVGTLDSIENIDLRSDLE